MESLLEQAQYGWQHDGTPHVTRVLIASPLADFSRSRYSPQWGPDAQLTPLGENQARRVHRAWKRETLANAPLPPVLYSSPLSRAASTCEITYEGLGARRPVFLEELRCA